MAKKSSNGHEDLSGAIEAMSRGQSAILDRVKQRDLTRKSLAKKRPSIDEQIRESDARVDTLAASYNPAPQELFSPAMTDGRLVDLTSSAGAFLAFIFGDVIKKKLSDRIRASATGDEMPSDEKARELAMLNAEDLRDWREFEAGAIAAEEHGLKILRPATEPIEIFLEFDPIANAVNFAKLKMLERAMNARRGETDEFFRERERLVQEQGRVQQQINELESLPRRPARTTEVVDGQKKILETLSNEMSDLNRRNSEIEGEYNVSAKLLSRSKEFLQKHKIGIKPGEVKVNLITG
jgi:hypothetical protein